MPGTSVRPLCHPSPWSCFRDKPTPVPKACWGSTGEEKDEHPGMAMALGGAPGDAPSLHPSAPNYPSLQVMNPGTGQAWLSPSAQQHPWVPLGRNHRRRVLPKGSGSMVRAALPSLLRQPYATTMGEPSSLSSSPSPSPMAAHTANSPLPPSAPLSQRMEPALSAP